MRWITSAEYPPGTARSKNHGHVELDTCSKTGTVDVVIYTTTIDFAHGKLNAHVSSPEMLDVTKYPTAEYKGKFIESKDGILETTAGELTLHGVTKPVTVDIDSFKCFQNPMVKKEVCEADATGTFNRADLGVNYGQQYGFKQEVLFRIQVEGIKAN